jgi:Cell morphogenesis central region
VEYAGINAMCALLTGPAFDPAVFDGDGPVFRFLTNVFRSKAVHIRCLGATGLTRFLESTTQRPAAFHQCVDLSYVTEKVVADACFLNMSRFLTRTVALSEDEDEDQSALAASASAADHAPPYMLSTMLTLVMYKCGDPEEAVRDAAVQLLRFLCTRFALQGTQSLSRFSGLLDVSDAFTLQQHHLSEQLSVALPDLTKEVFDEVLSRLATIQPTAQKRMVALLTPWVGNFNLTSMEKDQARLVLAKLCVLTLKHPNEPHLADHLWTRLVSSHPANIGVAFDFVFELAVRTQNTRALPMVKKVCLYLSRAAPETAIARLAAELESSREVRAPDPSRADARAQVSNPLSWQLEDMIPPHPFQHWFSRGDVALAALSSVVAEQPGQLVQHLPSFLFASLLAADHPNEAVHTEVRSLIYNLVHSTLTHLDADLNPVSATARARLYALMRPHSEEDQNAHSPPLWERDLVGG